MESEARRGREREQVPGPFESDGTAPRTEHCAPSLSIVAERALRSDAQLSRVIRGSSGTEGSVERAVSVVCAQIRGSHCVRETAE